MTHLWTSMKSESAREVVGTTAWGVVGLFGALFCGVVTARMLLPDDRGVLAILITTVTIVSIVSGLGTNISLRVLLPRDSRVTLRRYARISMLLAGVQLCILIGLTLFMLEVLNISMGIGSMLLTFIPLGLAAFFANQSSDALSATGHPSRASKANTIGFGVTATCLSFFWIMNLGLFAAIVAYTVGFVARTIVGVWMIERHHFTDSPSLEPGGTAVLVRQGVALMGMNLGQSVAYRLDQYLLAALANTREVGVYAVATTPASLIQVVSNSIGQVAFRDSALNKLSRKKALLFTLGATGLTATYAALLHWSAPMLIPFVFGAEYTAAVSVVQILVLAEVALAPYLVMSRAAVGAGHIRLSSLTGVVGMVAMALFLALFIPGNGGVGAAWACLSGYTTMSLFLLAGLLFIRWRQANVPVDSESGRSPAPLHTVIEQEDREGV